VLRRSERCTCSDCARLYFEVHLETGGWYDRYKLAESWLGIQLTNSDWASKSTDRKSTRGHVFLTDHNDGAICWASRKQNLIAMSTLETDSIACSEASERRNPE